MLLHGLEKKAGIAAIEEQMQPEVLGEGGPSEDGWRLPGAMASGALICVEGAAEGAGGALVGGEHGGSAGEGGGYFCWKLSRGLH